MGLSSTSWDFGVKDQGIREAHSIKVTNQGKRPLFILEVGATCGCIKTEMPTRRIEPDDTAAFIIHLDTTRKTGRVEKEAWFKTNVPAHRRVSIKVKGTIRPSWWTSVVALSFGKVPLSSQVTRTFFVYTEPGRKIELKSVQSDQSFLVVKAVPFSDTNGANGWKIEVVLDGNFKPGPFRANITVHTNFDNFSTQTIPVMGTIVGSISVVPSRIAFGLIKIGQTSERKLTLQNLGKIPLKILKVNCPDENLAARVIQEQEGQLFRIELRYTPRASHPKPTRGSIWIKTSDPARRLIRVPYSARHP